MTETTGQPTGGTETTPGTQTTAPGTEGQVNQSQTTANGTGQTEETFFDPESIKGKPELEAAYKQMQGAFSKKTAELKAGKQKIEAYDSFMIDPVKNIQQLASQYGYSLTKAQAQQIANAQETQNQFEPKSWDEVLNLAEERAEKRILSKLSPFLNQVKETRKGQLETLLDESCPDWRVYEDEMTKMMAEHPTLANDPVKLYRMSVPDEVWQSRATQAAIKKLQNKAESSQLSAGSTTNKTSADLPRGKMSFNDAYKAAKAKLASEGVVPPNSN